ncbi:hypothetical protein RhiirA5_420754 [Rhizophagus irregularis]|uniref:HAT C-terminal dimerisation domain-containing protein n=1 Tax=Rhizophagus irregularis TaxID=588596 RepID=A0A2N0PFJ1_9GLOM|nr:hypothetical protein RhiirA5_420754 [Rhizophagus irregularis]
MPPTSTVTAASRAREFPEDFFVDNGKLMCHFCDHSINFQTKNTITAHIGSKTHILDAFVTADIPLEKIVRNYIWLPISSCAVERSFSAYNKILDDDRQNLSLESLKFLTMM